MLKKILIAADHSPTALVLVNYATALSSIGVREVLLAHCFSLPEHVPFPVQTKANREAFLFKAGEILRKKDILVSVTAEDCFPGIRIPEIAVEINCSVILGARGRGYVSELFLGSVSHNVVRHAPAPVLVVSKRQPSAPT